MTFSEARKAVSAQTAASSAQRLAGVTHMGLLTMVRRRLSSRCTWTGEGDHRQGVEVGWEVSGSELVGCVCVWGWLFDKIG